MSDVPIDPSDLPEILEAEWGNDLMMELFSDLKNGAEVSHVQLRTANGDAAVSLEQARDAFLAGTAKAIQIRYRFEGESWSDTIMPGEPTTRIIRTKMLV